jgi:single-strand DNA-binding protein
MNGLNKAYFIGNLGRDPESKVARSGQTVVSFSLATPHVRKEGDGWVDNPDWHRLTAFGKTAESILKNAHKGDTMAVECVVRPGKWTDKEGATHYEVNLYVERVLWISQKRRGAEAPAGAMVVGGGETAAEAAELEAAEAEVAGEALPF